MFTCYYHPQVEAVAGCVRCRKLICGHCRLEKDGRSYCPHCYLWVKYNKQSATPESHDPESIKLLLKKMVERLGKETG